MRNFLKRLWYKYQLWQINIEYSKIDMDMQCTYMTYKQYVNDTDLLKHNRKYIETKLNNL